MGQVEVWHAGAGAIKGADPAAAVWQDDTLAWVLGAEGFPEAAIREALKTARSADVPFDQALYAIGEVCESDIVRMLAVRLGCGRLRPSDRASPQGWDHCTAIARGSLDLVDGRLAVVARGAALQRLLQSRHGGRLTPQVVLVTRQELLQLAMEANRRIVAERASGSLRNRYPHFSAASGVEAWQILVLTVLCLGLALPSLAGGALWLWPAILASVFFLSLAWLRLVLVATTATPPPQPVPASDAELPVYTLLVALHREEAAIGGLVASIAALDYPRAKLDVKFLIEENDEITRGALSRLPMPTWIELIAMPEGQPKTKPRALNAGLELARGDYTVVYDAEDRPDPSQLRAALACFGNEPDETAVVQARLTIDPAQRGFWPDHFRMEYAGLFGVQLPALAALRLPLPLGGTSNHFRTEALRHVGGWDAFNVTEDADLGIRLHRFGYSGATIRSATEEEAPESFRVWLPQRTRWLKGWMMTLIVHLRSPSALYREAGAAGASAFLLLAGGLVASALLEPLCLTLALFELCTNPDFLRASSMTETLTITLFLTSLVIGHVVAGVVGTLGLIRGGHRISPFALASLPIYWLMVSIAAWRAVFQLFAQPNRWEKTEHRLARMPKQVDRNA